MSSKSQRIQGPGQTEGASYVDFKVGLPVRVQQALRMFKRQAVQSILDVGCADGAFLSQFPTSVRRVGIDLAPNRFRPHDLEVVAVDVCREPLPFPPASFDAVYGGEIIEHVLDTERFLLEIRRVLKPHGLMVLTTPNLCSLKNLYLWMRGRQFAWVDYKEHQYGHVRYFSPDSLRTVLSDTGFAVEKLCSSGFELGAHSAALGWMTPLTQFVFSYSTRGNCLIVSATPQD